MYEELRQIEIEEPKKHIGIVLERPKTDLATLYEHGWWITEIFGSWAVLVKLSECKTRKTKAPYFLCFWSQLNTKYITKKALKTIVKVKNKQWNKYENYLKYNQYNQDVPTTKILLEKQGQHSKKISRTC